VYKITTEVTVLRRKHQVTMKTGLVGATSVAMLLHDLKHLPIDAVLDEVTEAEDEDGNYVPALVFHEERVVDP